MKIYKRLFLLLVLASLTLSAASNVGLTTLTLINKSDMPIAFKMIEPKQKTFFYLPVAKGSHDNPTEKVFTIPRGYYVTQLYYIETWDPVYGFQCSQPRSKVLPITGTQRIVFLHCQVRPPNLGEPRMLKYWPYPWHIYPR